MSTGNQSEAADASVVRGDAGQSDTSDEEEDGVNGTTEGAAAPAVLQAPAGLDETVELGVEVTEEAEELGEESSQEDAGE